MPKQESTIEEYVQQPEISEAKVIRGNFRNFIVEHKEFFDVLNANPAQITEAFKRIVVSATNTKAHREGLNAFVGANVDYFQGLLAQAPEIKAGLKNINPDTVKNGLKGLTLEKLTDQVRRKGIFYSSLAEVCGGSAATVLSLQKTLEFITQSTGAPALGGAALAASLLLFTAASYIGVIYPYEAQADKPFPEGISDAQRKDLMKQRDELITKRTNLIVKINDFAKKGSQSYLIAGALLQNPMFAASGLLYWKACNTRVNGRQGPPVPKPSWENGTPATQKIKDTGRYVKQVLDNNPFVKAEVIMLPGLLASSYGLISMLPPSIPLYGSILGIAAGTTIRNLTCAIQKTSAEEKVEEEESKQMKKSKHQSKQRKTFLAMGRVAARKGVTLRHRPNAL